MTISNNVCRWLLVCLLCVVSTSSLYAQFGKNKVQYQEFEWKYVQSKHFDVYYHQNGEYLAQYTAVIAERELKKLERDLNYRITQRISIIVYNSHNEFQQTNVISSFLPKGWAGLQSCTRTASFFLSRENGTSSTM
jgi:hypothetical protein